MQQRLLSFLILSLAMTGCSSSTGILPAGPDTYTVSERYSPIIGGGTEAERKAMTESNQYCEEHGREFVPLERNDSGDHTQMGNTGFSLTFRCLLPSDPQLKEFRFGPVVNAPGPAPAK